jgi:hypothetical protein
VPDAIKDKSTSPGAIKNAIVARHGEDSVAYDPSDREAGERLVGQGFNVIGGGTYDKDTWSRIREAEVLKPAGVVSPTPKPYSPDGTPENVIPRDEWTGEMSELALFCERLGHKLLNTKITVVFVKNLHAWWGANYGKGRLCINLGRLGMKWADKNLDDEDVLDLVIHEFGHHFESSHLSAKYHDALTKLGAQMARLALQEPKLFERKAG